VKAAISLADHVKSSHHRSFAMKEMIETIARALVDEPELVSVSEVGGRYTSILELTVAKTDIGKVIGKQGRTADALRTLLSAVSAKAKKRSLLEIVG
jgi:predicted RNA-binding protein YlqC (UPF0109 family)